MLRSHGLGQARRPRSRLLAAAPFVLALAAGCSTAPAPVHEAVGTTTQAETDTFGLGEGRSGPLTVSAAGTIVNAYAPITAVDGTGTQITVGIQQGVSTPFAPGDLLLVWRATGLTLSSAYSGDQSTFALTDVGGYEFARVKTVAGSTLTVTNPLTSTTRYVTGSQVVRVPEYTNVEIPAGAGIVPYAWDGSSGGIVVFFATTSVTNSGSVAADGAGFRGGGLEDASLSLAPGCTARDGSDEATPCGGAHKGEGIFPGSFAIASVTPGGDPTTTYGYGDYANGAGGGEARNAGGGGGGHFGQGGNGGETAGSDGSRAYGGLGGAPLSYTATTNVTMGGGGGAGDEDHGTGTAGAPGGGVVFVRAATIIGDGTFTALGGSVTATAGTDGSGGGGAGGAVLLFSAGVVDCTSASANGGAGGSGGSEPDGPGGGGGGGLVYVEASSTTCTFTVDPGLAGATTDSGIGGTYGAGAGADGSLFYSSGAEYGGGACTPSIIATNKCGGCVTNGDCPASDAICNTASNSCGPCNGNYGSSATAPCPSQSTPLCATTGTLAGTCVACLTGADCTTAAAPACSTLTSTCTACDGDEGTGATAACPASTAPYCQAAGTCGKCTQDSDCATGTHAGPRCDVTTGACGDTCSNDATCNAGDAGGTAKWCDSLGDGGMGVCQPKIPNGSPLPSGGFCSTIGSSACASGACDPTDNECGIANGQSCPTQGAAGCRSGACVASGPNAGKCEPCASDSNCSGDTPACSPTTSTCVDCTATNSSKCAGDVPLCDTSTSFCASCQADYGAKSAMACPSASAPFCAPVGACSKCTTNSDCAGSLHAGTICEATTGACGTTCQTTPQCGSNLWCNAVDGGAGTCQAQLPNGAPLPTNPPGLSTCTAAVGAEVCVAGVCNPKNNTCGAEPTDAGVVREAGPPTPDAGLLNIGVSIEGGALSCDVRGGPRSSGGLAGLSGLLLAVGAALARRRR
jgi:hypothetical protein